MSAVLLAVALMVGFCIGAVGVGGILLIPPLTLFGGIEIHQAAATALFSFVFTGLYGTWLFHGRGSINWRVSVPVCVGAVVCSYIGAWVSSMVDAETLKLVIALITIAAGLYILLPAGRRTQDALDGHSARQIATLAGVGAAAGFGSGLSGAGGPLFSVPLMLLLGFTPLTAIGTGQVLQIVAASSGSLGNLRHGSIDFGLAGWLAVCELAGVFVGVHVAHRAKTQHLRAMVAALCIAVGGWMLLKP